MESDRRPYSSGPPKRSTVAPDWSTRLAPSCANFSGAHRRRSWFFIDDEPAWNQIGGRTHRDRRRGARLRRIGRQGLRRVAQISQAPIVGARGFSSTMSLHGIRSEAVLIGTAEEEHGCAGLVDKACAELRKFLRRPSSALVVFHRR